MADAFIATETGRIINARSRVPGNAHGELVFTTAYTGYEESLTDPSYANQILTFAYPLIGNYGVRPDRFESDNVQPTAVIARELTDDVVEWLESESTPAIDELDTRDIVLDIRDLGAMKCGIAAGPDATPEQAEAQLADCPHMSEHTEIGAAVSVTEPTHYDGTGPEIALIDCGAKRSIINSLCDRDAAVTVLPYDTTPDTITDLDPDLLFISNGPGDPKNFNAAETLVDEFVGELPIAGICLGQQIVANALGGDTTKMEFGHRGVNQPVRDLDTDKVVMTTQNHGYTVDDTGSLTITQRNVNDKTPEGLESTELNILTRQYHPEAHPGPNDTLDFFDDVLDLTSTEPQSAIAD